MTRFLNSLQRAAAFAWPVVLVGMLIVTPWIVVKTYREKVAGER